MSRWRMCCLDFAFFLRSSSTLTRQERTLDIGVRSSAFLYIAETEFRGFEGKRFAFLSSSMKGVAPAPVLEIDYTLCIR